MNLERGDTPPHNEQAESYLLREQCVVGAMLLAGSRDDRDTIAATLDAVEPPDYCGPRNAVIHRAIAKLHAEGETIDVVTVSDQLHLAGRMEECGGLSYLMEALQVTPSIAHGPHYAMLVKRDADHRRRRDRVRTAFETLDDPTAHESDKRAALAAVANLADGDVDRRGSVTVADIWGDLDPRERPPRREFPIGHGFEEVGLSPGKIVLLGAPPGGGKTCLAMQWSVDALLADPDLTAIVANIEMPPIDLLDRQISRLGDVPYDVIRNRPAMLGRIHGDPIAHAMGLLEEIKDRLRFARDPHVIENVAGEVERYKPSIVILDYLQRIGPR